MYNCSSTLEANFLYSKYAKRQNDINIESNSQLQKEDYGNGKLITV